MKSERNFHGNGDQAVLIRCGDTTGNVASDRSEEALRAAMPATVEETRPAEVPALLRPKITPSPSKWR